MEEQTDKNIYRMMQVNKELKTNNVVAIFICDNFLSQLLSHEFWSWDLQSFKVIFYFFIIKVTNTHRKQKGVNRPI